MDCGCIADYEQVRALLDLLEYAWDNTHPAHSMLPRPVELIGRILLPREMRSVKNPHNSQVRKNKIITVEYV